MLNSFREKIAHKDACIAVIGLGYVGLPLMLRFAEEGFNVLGLDVDAKKVSMLEQGKSYIHHIQSEQIVKYQPRCKVSTDFSCCSHADALILCVPTPLTKHREPDLSYVLQTLDSLLPHLRAGQIVSLESTTYPGTTEEILKPKIEAQGFVIGQDIFLVYSPEREDPGNPNFTTASIPKVCGGDTPGCRAAGFALYSAVIHEIVPVSSTKVAEMCKLLENIHRSVNIGLVNEMKMAADKMGIDIREVIDAAATKPFGFVPYYPGPGIGGHCIPIDPFYLTWKAREFGIHTRFIELAGEINSQMPTWVVGKITEALNAQSLAVNNSRILILGLAYKRDVDDVRESPSIEMMELLEKRGAHVDYSDPYVSSFPMMRAHYFHLNSVCISEETLSVYDCVVLATAHQAFDYPFIAQHAKLIIDTRGAFKAYRQTNIISA